MMSLTDSSINLGAKQLNFAHHTPFDTRNNSKVEVYVILVVFRGCQSTKHCHSKDSVPRVNMKGQHR